MEIWSSFRLVLEGKTGTELPESSRSEFLEKFLANNFALLDAEDNTSSQLNKGGIGQKPKDPRAKFWEVMDSFASVVYASLAASRTLLQWLLAQGSK